MKKVEDLKVNIDFVVISQDALEVRAEIPLMFPDYRVMFTMPTTLHDTPGIKAIVADFAIKLATQWLVAGGARIVSTEITDARQDARDTNIN